MTVTESGNYDLSVRVKDSNGVESGWKKVTFSASRPPVAEPFLFDDNVKEGVLMAFDASDSYDPEGEDIEYFFDFGDGTDSNWTDTAIVKHTYKENDDYTVKLTVRDEYGITSSYTDYVTIKGDSPDESTISEDMPIAIIGAAGVIAVLVAFLFLSSRKKPEEEEAGTPEVSMAPQGGPPVPAVSPTQTILPAPGATPGIPQQAAGQQAPSPTGPVPLPTTAGARPLPPLPGDDDDIIMPRMDTEIIYPKGYTPPESQTPPPPAGEGGPEWEDDEKDAGGQPDESDGSKESDDGSDESTKGSDKSNKGSDETSGDKKGENPDEDDGIVYPKGMKPS
jgi:PKD repeat protein